MMAKLLLVALAGALSALPNMLPLSWCLLAYKKLDLNTEKTLFYHEGSQTLEQLAQRDCGVSIHRDIQSLSGNGPEQL